MEKIGYSDIIYKISVNQIRQTIQRRFFRTEDTDMGRSKMQGTPWHYEYFPVNKKKNKKRNSINCVYNTGIKCTCLLSENHGNKCIGENYCTEFERCSFSRPEIYKSNNTSSSSGRTIIKSEKVIAKKNLKHTVEKGDTITIMDSEGERIEIKLTDVNNPFYNKSLNEKVSVKGERYRILYIKKH